MAATNDVLIDVLGDLLNLPFETNVTHVVQQLNCLTTRGAGLSRSVSKKWPWADVYSRRTKMSRRENLAAVTSQAVPGTILVDTPPVDVEAPFCVSFFAQWDYGRPASHRAGRPSVNKKHCVFREGYGGDSSRNRNVWFQRCLIALAEELKDFDRPKVAFPYKIGCGLARGNWDDYRKLINEWSLKHQIPTIIVHWDKKTKKRSLDDFLKHPDHHIAKRKKNLSKKMNTR